MDCFVWEQASADEKAAVCAEVCKAFAILFHHPQTMFDRNLLVTSVISSYFGVEVTEYHYKIFFLRFVDLTLCLVGNE